MTQVLLKPTIIYDNSFLKGESKLRQSNSLTFFQSLSEVKHSLASGISLFSSDHILVHLKTQMTQVSHSLIDTIGLVNYVKLICIFLTLTLDKGIRRLRSNDKITLVRRTIKVTRAAFSKSVSCT